MCVVDKEGKYELLICDKDHSPILSIDFGSIGSLCRVLNDADLSKCDFKVYRKKDCQEFDVGLLLELWRAEK